MLAIVQHQQEMPIFQVVAEGVFDQTAAVVTDSKRRRDRLRNQTGIGKRREFDEPDAIVVGRQRIGRDLQSIMYEPTSDAYR